MSFCYHSVFLSISLCRSVSVPVFCTSLSCKVFFYFFSLSLLQSSIINLLIRASSWDLRQIFSQALSLQKHILELLSQSRSSLTFHSLTLSCFLCFLSNPSWRCHLSVFSTLYGVTHAGQEIQNTFRTSRCFLRLFYPVLDFLSFLKIFLTILSANIIHDMEKNTLR